ncbi:ferritin-like domain-containing protein [Blastococcus capsensis]|uniref:ferritin-like domain-containing protein n=1 Tax=Blastococcus capsensis TaxID=1564163 RepID=UPI0025423AB1|nr:ferritin-like domain-containing protein [Blastococcus capsensis]MDK3257799.1 ferritin-like domain-containing protein [Blastococcus capsensis]
MADDENTPMATENAALSDALAAAHAAVWGYGVVGAALPTDARAAAVAAEDAHRGIRDALIALLGERGADPVLPEAGYALPFPVLSAVDAAALAAVLEGGVAAAWVRVVDGAVERSTRALAMEVLSAAEVRAVGWRTAAGQPPVTRAFPGLQQ